MTTISDYLKKELSKGIAYEGTFSLEDHLEQIRHNIREGATVQALAYITNLILQLQKETKKIRETAVEDDEMML